MFLNRRPNQEEYFDDLTRSPAEIASGYHWLGRFNRLFDFSRPFRRLIPPLIGESACHSLTLLDLGAGDGSLGIRLASWAASKGWHWDTTHLDLNHKGLSLNPSPKKVTADAAYLPFRDESFDMVIASQMTHHLGDEAEVEQHFREAWRVSRQGVIILDLHRSCLLFVTIWFVILALRPPKPFASDAMLSVRRGWRLAEWEQLAKRAGIGRPHIRVEHGVRLILRALK